MCISHRRPIYLLYVGPATYPGRDTSTAFNVKRLLYRMGSVPPRGNGDRFASARGSNIHDRIGSGRSTCVCTRDNMASLLCVGGNRFSSRRRRCKSYPRAEPREGQEHIKRRAPIYAWNCASSKRRGKPSCTYISWVRLATPPTQDRRRTGLRRVASPSASRSNLLSLASSVSKANEPAKTDGRLNCHAPKRISSRRSKARTKKCGKVRGKQTVRQMQ